MPKTSPGTTDPAAPAARNRSWLFVYIATFVAAATGPIVLAMLATEGVAWHAETRTFWSLIAQVLPVLLLAIAVEQVVFGEREQPADGSLGAFIFVIVVGSVTIAELLALLLLAFPRPEGGCIGARPSALTGAATLFTAAAIPATLVLLILFGAIRSGLPFGAGIQRFQRSATLIFAGALTLPLTGLGVAAVATGRVGAGIVAFLITAVLGSKASVRERDEEHGEHIDLDFFGRTLFEVGDDADAGDGEPNPATT